MADEESIDYQIRIEAAQALKDLEDITSTASSMPEVIQAVENALQGLADKFGISLGAAQKEFQDTIRMAASLRDQMDKLNEAGAEGLVTFSPYLQNMANVQSPFGEMGDAAGWKAVADARRESAAMAAQELKSISASAAEQNALTKLTQEEALAREKAITEIINAIDAENKALAEQEARDEKSGTC